MNRLVSYSIILLLWVSSAFAQEKRSETQLEKPRLVVFVVGIDNAQLSDYVTNLISNYLSQAYHHPTYRRHQEEDAGAEKVRR